MKQPEFFNPLGYVALSDSLERAIMSSEEYPMTIVRDYAFNGYGIYALFYNGDFPAYHRLSTQNRTDPGTWPVYIGVAAPKTLKGTQLKPGDVDKNQPEKGLFRRIKDHAKSIEAADNLDIGDFTCKLLTLSFMWAPVAESAMIGAYEPIWNAHVTGFGNHVQGQGRSTGMQTIWDTLHPGRAMNGTPNKRSVQDIVMEVEASLEETWQKKFRQIG